MLHFCLTFPLFLFPNSQRAVTTALRCNFLVLSLKLGVWLVSSSHVILAEALHSLADIANRYGYFKERFVWSLISAVGFFCLGSGATIVNGFQNLWTSQVVDSVHDYKSEVIGPGFFRFKAEIDFNGVKLVQNYLNRAGRKQVVKQKDDAVIMEVMSHYGEEVVTALGAEVDRLEKEIQEIVPGIKHVDIEAHSSIGSSP
ncbi:hypothetical protein RDI58_009562 [Solanum bulbocastanum]|uniref:Metal tolerance protein n=1 Tax=Solanum bulbocastanum TaxID=147425 RepID=A0AAN8YKX1_SOLBU